MQNLLFVTSSLFGEDSISRQIAGELVAALADERPGTTVMLRALDPDTTPHLSRATMMALTAAAVDRDAQHSALGAYADRLVEEIETADIIVIAAPMYNFSVSSTLKAWIDHIARAGRTFRYTAAGPEGLLKNKKVYVVTSRGGYYSGDGAARDADFQEPYLRTVLGFLGLDDITFIRAEGLKVSAGDAARGVARARAAIGGIVPLGVAA
jgi:FMN-dependent NADH-azoreductase